MARPTSTWVRLAVQNFTSIGAGGGVGMRPQNIKNSRGEPIDRFLKKNLGAFVRPTILHKNFEIDVIRFTGYGVIAEKPLVGQLGRIFPCTL